MREGDWLPYGVPRPAFVPGSAEGARDRLDDARRLLSAASGPRLPALLARARALTDRVFGRSILLYAPCYLSSWCVNHCAYCGFNFKMPIPRVRLSRDDALREIAWLAARGLRRVLLVAGDYPAKATPDYLEAIIDGARRVAPEIDLEVAPAPARHYARWAAAGAAGVTCYQETYDERAYARLHPRGPKRVFAFRLGTLERAAAAGMTRLGLGVLLGLADPVPDLIALIAHARFLRDRFPGASVTVSLPRLRPAVPGFEGPYQVEDRALLRFYAALRLALPEAGLAVSTREPASLRRDLLEAGVTQMSAGSVTVPGGYASRRGGGGQFDVADHRSVAEVAADLRSMGYRLR